MHNDILSRKMQTRADIKLAESPKPPGSASVDIFQTPDKIEEEKKPPEYQNGRGNNLERKGLICKNPEADIVGEIRPLQSLSLLSYPLPHSVFHWAVRSKCFLFHSIFLVAFRGLRWPWRPSSRSGVHLAQKSREGEVTANAHVFNWS